MISTGTVNEIEPTPKAKDQGHPSLILCFGMHMGQLETHLVVLIVVSVTYWWIGQVQGEGTAIMTCPFVVSVTY